MSQNKAKCPLCPLGFSKKRYLDCEDKDGNKIRWLVSEDIYLKIQKLIENDRDRGL